MKFVVHMDYNSTNDVGLPLPEFEVGAVEGGEGAVHGDAVGFEGADVAVEDGLGVEVDGVFAEVDLEVLDILEVADGLAEVLEGGLVDLVVPRDEGGRRYMRTRTMVETAFILERLVPRLRKPASWRSLLER